MKHGVKTRKLGREKGQRDALLASLAESLIKHGSITTTEAKAKSLRPYIEKLITRAREDSVANRRVVRAKLGNRDAATESLFKDVAPKFAGRAGGYTRVLKLSRRESDGAPMAIIQFVE
jgi:large subunit ribosomal protein L17